MKKISITILTVSLLVIASCKKDAKVSGGSWAFKGTTYDVKSGIPSSSDNTLVLVSSGSNTYNQLLFSFYTLPPADGSYTVVQGAPDSTNTQIGVSMTLTTGATYTGPTYWPVSSPSATVTVVNGRIKVSLPSTDMMNTTDSTDVSALTATVNQTVDY